jgi:type IV pilus assembly protein PilW
MVQEQEHWVVGDPRKEPMNSKLIITEDKGFTLVEMMVAALASAAIVAAGFGALTVSQKVTRANSQAMNTQSTARNALDMITADLKLAGFGMQGATAPIGGCAINGTAAAIVPADNNPGGLVTDTGPDIISMVVPMTNSVALAGPLWQLTANIGPGFNAIPMPAAAITAMGNAIPGGAPALLGMNVSIGGAVTSQIVGVGGATLNLNPVVSAPVQFGAGTQVYLLQCITYQVIPPPDALGLCLGNAPCLVRGVAPVGVSGPNCINPGNSCVPIMDGVEDLQLAFACDGCSATINSGNPDGQIDDLDGSLNFSQGDFIMNVNWFAPGAPFNPTYMTPGKIRLAQVTLVARQTAVDQGSGEVNQVQINSGVIPIVGGDHNHANGVFVPGDNATAAQQEAYLQFRRRILTRTVELRNQRS